MIARGNEFQSLIAIYHHLYSAKGGGGIIVQTGPLSVTLS